MNPNQPAANEIDSDDENVVPPPPPVNAYDDEDENEEEETDSDDEEVRRRPPPPTNTDESDDDTVESENDQAIETDDDEAVETDEDETEDMFTGNALPQTMAIKPRDAAASIVENDIDTDNDTDDDDENYLQKFDDALHNQVITNHHPEMKSHNYDEITAMSKVTRNESGAIIDPLHRSVPFVTRYEKAKLIGERATQLSAGATPLVDVDENIIDDYVIALKEFNEKKIPFIIKRPMPNGGCEYWRLEDLEILI